MLSLHTKIRTVPPAHLPHPLTRRTCSPAAPAHPSTRYTCSPAYPLTRCYSYLSAFIGSMRDALIAGSNPASIAIAASNVTEMTSTHGSRPFI